MKCNADARLRREAGGVAALTLALAVGCAAPESSDREPYPGPEAADVSSRTLTILFEGDDYVLGPSADDHPKYLMFEPLVRGYGPAATPGLAERWEHSDDTRTLTFHLRRDVVWHDGAPFTSADVAFTFTLLRHPAVGALRWPILSVETPDEHTVRLEFSRPVGLHGGLDGWQVLYPRHLLGDLDPTDFYDWDFWKEPVGSGPYRYVRSVPNTMLELAANPDYFEGRPRIDRVVLRLGSANPVLELLGENADAVYYVTSADIPKLTADERFRVYHQWIHSEPQAIHWNLGHPFLSDARVRRALGHAINRRELARMLYLPDEMPLVGGLSPESRADEMYREGRLEQGPAFDPAEAERLLADAGWADSDGDGIRERDGVDAGFTLVARNGGILSTLEPAVLLQEHLRRVGVAMEILPVEPSVWRELWNSGEFDATVHDVANDPAILIRTDFFGDGTRTGYRNNEIGHLLAAIQADTTVSGQDELYADVNAILRRDAPFTPLFPYFESYAAHRRVVGLSTPDRPHPIKEIWDLELEPFEQDRE